MWILMVDYQLGFYIFYDLKSLFEIVVLLVCYDIIVFDFLCFILVYVCYFEFWKLK